MAKKNCMTLVEMLMVLAIIGVLMGMVIGAVVKVGNKGKLVKAMAMMKGIQTAVTEYERRYGVMPAGQFVASRYNSNDDQTVKFAPKASSDNRSYEPISGSSDPKSSSYDPSDDDFRTMLGYLVNSKTAVDTTLKVGSTSYINQDGVTFLKPDSAVDPTFKYKDPWRHCYVIYLDVDLDGKTKVDVLGSNKYVDGRAQLYSFGPNGKDDGGGGDDLTTWRKDKAY